MEWTVKQMAEKTGFSVDALRYYDKIGIVSPRRKENGYRYYTEKDYVLLQYVTVMKYASFSLSEIKTVTATLFQEPSDECNRINQDLLSCKHAELTLAVQNLQNILRLIDKIRPLLGNAQAFAANADELQGFIGRIYDDIKEAGWTLSR